ncbi:MAG: BtpA/SgcQ family protein [Granulosicoccus sp.]
MHSITSKPDDTITSLFGGKALIGVIHCPAFPGSPRYDGRGIETIYDTCMRDVEAYMEGGMNGLIVENHGDIPFLKPDRIGCETTGFLSVITDRIVNQVDCPVGVNVLANAPIPAFAVAVAAGASFIRVNQWANAYVANEGFIEGQAGEALRYRANLQANHIQVFADSHVKHGSHAIVADRSVEELTRDVAFFDADAVIATGHRTGNAATLEEITSIGSSTRLPLLVGSGVTPDNIATILEHVDGVIVASSLKRDGDWWNEVQLPRVKSLVKAANQST